LPQEHDMVKTALLLSLLVFGCSSAPAPRADVGDSTVDTDRGSEPLDVDSQSHPGDVADEVSGDGAHDEVGNEVSDARPLVVMTFNTGTSLVPPAGAINKGFGKQQAAWCDEYYGNGLSWMALIEDARVFVEGVSPDLIVFQEIFHPEECAGIPEEARVGFICEHWKAGDPTVAQMVAGEQYQVACHPGKPDKCAAVHKRLGRFASCKADFCLEGLDGYTVDGCGKGARVARGRVEGPNGPLLTLVSVHGSSGFKEEDSECRVRQFDQIFVDLGDGEAGANGGLNIIMGDFNTDPAAMADADASARRLLEFVGVGKPFGFVNAVGSDAEKTYGGLFTIDYVISDGCDGSCWTAGVSPGHPPVTDAVAFDHHPTVCNLTCPWPTLSR